jgi:hypothetical protein
LQNPSALKRRKELNRQQKQREKEMKREQRKKERQERLAAGESGPEIGEPINLMPDQVSEPGKENSTD